MRIGVDLTPCWRPRVGMVTAAVALSAALVEAATAAGDDVVGLASRVPVPGVGAAPWILSPYRHEVANKLRWLPQVEAGAGLDAIFYPYWPSPPRRRAGAPPAVSFVHDLAFRLRPREVPWQQRAYLGTLLPRAVRHDAALLTPSAATRGDLLAAYPAPGLAERVRVAGEGPTPLPSPGPLPPGLQPGFVLAVGTLEPRKNFDRLAAAHARLGAGAPPLVIAGRPGWNGARPPQGANLHLVGHVDDATLAGLYEGAAVVALPSLYEGFGLPLVDAMARGIPALVSDRGSLPEVAGEGALQVDPDSVEAIAEGLRRLLGDSQLRRRLASAARRRAGRHSWSASAEVVLETLHQVGAPAS